MHSRQTFLLSDGEAFLQKESQKFDVAMGSYDSAEVAELGLEKFIPQQNRGLYRDDGLSVTDTTLNLDNGSLKPSRKETNPPCYIKGTEYLKKVI